MLRGCGFRPVALLCCLLTGCSGAATITGTVTYDGTPVTKGAITFLPADGVGPVVGARITDGEYRVDAVIPGPKVVKIEAVKAVPFARSSAEMARRAAKARAYGDPSGLIDPADVVPADAVGKNARVEVSAGAVRLDFQLTPPKR